MPDNHSSFQQRYHRLEEEYRNFRHSVSHFLKAPLSALIGYSTLLLDQGRQAPASDRYLQRIVDNSRLMDKMIEDLLLVSRLGEPSSTHCSLDRVVHETLHSLEAQVRDKEIRLWIQPAIPPPPMEERHLSQLCFQLLSNAVRYSPSGGRVSVGFLDGNYYVSDRGGGMSEEVRNKALDIFFTTEKGEPTHTGAGLFIAARIVRMYDGTIRLESSPGFGTTVLFRLPDRNPISA